MEKTLSVIRWILHKLAIVLLGLTIWFFIPLVGFGVNITNSEQVKSWFSESNTYQNILDEAPLLITQDEQTAVKGADEQAIVKAILPAIPADFLQTQAEGFVDGMYGWLQGDTVQPEFAVSLKERAPQIEKLVAAELERQISKIPACTSIEQAAQQAAQQAGSDPLEADCIPPGVDISAEAKKQAHEFINNKDDGPINTAFTGEDLNISSASLLNAPTAFESLELAPMFFWAFLFAFAAITILTARRWQRGLKEVGLTMLISAGILFFASFIASRLANAPGKFISTKNNNGSVEGQAAANIMEPLAKAITSDVASSVMLFSGIVLLIGAMAFAAGWYFGKSKNPSAPATPKQDEQKKKKNEVPELMRDDNDHNFIEKVHQEKNAPKPKIRDKIKKRLVQ